MWRFVYSDLLGEAVNDFESPPFDSVPALGIRRISVCCLAHLFLLQDCFPEFWVPPFLPLFPIPLPRLLGFFRPLVFL
jgi:hypothetical protein